MKVEGPNKSQNTSQSKKKDKASSSDSSFGDYLVGNTKSAGASSATQSIAKIDALLAVQSAEDPAEKKAKKQMIIRADKIRIALLTGNLTIGHLLDVADVVSSHREVINDPQLSALLDEIDLRAQIELAKLNMAMDKQ